MSYSERVLLFALVYSLTPARCLEIGAFKGGSMALIAAALKKNGHGHLWSVDPAHQVGEYDQDRVTLVHGASPAALAGLGQFNFVLIDGAHDYDSVLADCLGVFPLLSPGAVVLFHDAYHAGVAQAVNDWVNRFPVLADGGIVDGSRVVQDGNVWGGLRCVRLRPRRWEDRYLTADSWLLGQLVGAPNVEHHRFPTKMCESSYRGEKRLERPNESP
jgi:hypothetical protein